MINQEYPYSVTGGRLKDFIAGIQKMSVPTKVNASVLHSLGYKSTNDRSIISILRWINLIDTLGTPTKYWQDMRDEKKAPLVLADRIRHAYGDLFELYNDANNRSDDDLRNFMQGRSRSGGRAVAAMLSTFKILCSFADFSNVSVKEKDEVAFHSQIEYSVDDSCQRRCIFASNPIIIPLAANPSATINLSIQLPENANSEYIDAIFASIARHVLGPLSREEAVELAKGDSTDFPVDKDVKMGPEILEED